MAHFNSLIQMTNYHLGRISAEVERPSLARSPPAAEQTRAPPTLARAPPFMRLNWIQFDSIAFKFKVRHSSEIRRDNADAALKRPVELEGRRALEANWQWSWSTKSQWNGKANTNGNERVENKRETRMRLGSDMQTGRPLRALPPRLLTCFVGLLASRARCRRHQHQRHHQQLDPDRRAR